MAQVLITIDDFLVGPERESVIEQYKMQLTDGHHDKCPWKHNECSSELGNPFILRVNDIAKMFETRLKSLNSLWVYKDNIGFIA